MAMSAHLAELAEKHRILDEQIEKAISSPSTDDVHIRKMKQEKLKLKDEMERLTKATRH